jgi:hypothetical protein
VWTERASATQVDLKGLGGDVEAPVVGNCQIAP